jgi:hypothetical protein
MITVAVNSLTSFASGFVIFMFLVNENFFRKERNTKKFFRVI